MIRVKFLLSRLPPLTGGELYDAKMAESLVGEPFSVQAIQVGPLLEEARRRWGRLFTLPLLGPVLASAFCIRRFGGPAELVISPHRFRYELFGYHLWQRLRHGSRTVIILHHYEPEGIPMGRLRRIKETVVLSLFLRIVAISQFDRELLVGLGFPSHRVAIIYPGFDSIELNKYNGTQSALPDRGTQLLFVGHVYRRKGVDYLLEALAKLKEANVVLHIVGDLAKDPDYSRQVQAQSAGFGKRVIFHGRVEPEELNALYRQADIFVLPSLMEGFGIVLLEAMHYGLPIVATQVGAIPELVEDGANGLLVTPRDATALAQALECLLGDASLRRRLGEEGWRRVMAGDFSWEASQKRFRSLIENLVAEGK